MPQEHLAELLNRLAEAGELVRIADVVQPVGEIAELTRRFMRGNGGPALLFERVAGAASPVLTNLLGADRLASILGAADLSEPLARMDQWLTPRLPESWTESLKLINPLARGGRLGTRAVKAAFVQQVVKLGRDVNLHDYPFPYLWPQETGPTITAGVLILPGLDGESRIIEQPVLELRARDELVVHWTGRHAGPQLFEAYRAAGRPLPAAVVLGEPALRVAALAPALPETDPLFLTSLLRGVPLPVCRGRSVEIDVPADAEMIIEGYIDPAEEPTASGAVAGPLGQVSERTELPILRVSGITHRANPIIPVVVCGPRGGEESSLNPLFEQMLLLQLRRWNLGVVRLHFPAAAGRRVAVVSIRKTHPGHAFQVMHALWGIGWLAGLKLIVVVDAEIDPADDTGVWRQVALHVDGERDVRTLRGAADFEDHSNWPGFGSKTGIDATGKRPDEGAHYVPVMASATTDVRERMQRLWTDRHWSGGADAHR